MNKVALFLALVLSVGLCEAKIILYDDCESDRYLGSEWGTTGGPVSVSKEQARAGVSSYKFFQRAVVDVRSELVTRFDLVPDIDNWEFGKEYWMGWSLYVPSDIQWTVYNPLVTQWHLLTAEDKGCPSRVDGKAATQPFSITLQKDGTGVIARSTISCVPSVCWNGSYTNWKTYSGPSIRLGDWNDFVVHVKFEYNKPGINEVWLNGQKFVDNTAKCNAHYDPKGPQLKIGVYASGGNEADTIVYYDEIRMGDASSSYTEVAPRGSPAPVCQYCCSASQTCPSSLTTVGACARCCPSACAESVTDTSPPSRKSGAPTGSLPQGTMKTTLSLSTEEDATCRYSLNAGTSYASMTGIFTTTGSTFHSSMISGLSDGKSYSYHVRCKDGAGNMNPDDFTISFSVSSSLPEDSSTLPSIADTVIADVSPDTLLAALPSIFAGARQQGERQRALIRFGQLPSGTVKSATLILTAVDTQQVDVATTITVRRMLQQWNDATWNHASANERWVSDAGKDGGTDAGCGTGCSSATGEAKTTLTSSPSEGTIISFDITGIAQSWASGQANHGLLISSPQEGGVKDFVRFASSEHEVAAYHPRLVISYSGDSVAADKDGNGCVALTELVSFIDRWRRYQEGTLSDVLGAVNSWKAGC